MQEGHCAENSSLESLPGSCAPLLVWGTQSGKISIQSPRASQSTCLNKKRPASNFKHLTSNNQANASVSEHVWMLQPTSIEHSGQQLWSTWAAAAPLAYLGSGSSSEACSLWCGGFALAAGVASCGPARGGGFLQCKQ